MPSFDEFLKSGQVGELSIGMTRESVQHILGPPDDTSVKKRPEVWKYGSCELSFHRISDGLSGILDSIQYYYHTQQVEHRSHTKLTFTGWSPSSSTTIGEFLNYLGQINMNPVGGVLAGPSPRLILESSARISYEWGQLWSVSFSDPKESKQKQISVSIPVDQFLALQAEAKSRGLSASSLCSLWISDHVLSLDAQKA